MVVGHGPAFTSHDPIGRRTPRPTPHTKYSLETTLSIIPTRGLHMFGLAISCRRFPLLMADSLHIYWSE
jgi:hypothetical protein